jgi:hypothetical protein
MKLERLILVNWGFVVSREYQFGDTTLLSGATGVGKSSFQDAIQLIMTGGKQHINVFNSAQDEVGGGRAGSKVRRTLASYAVGMRDNLCARPNGSHTYVAAIFSPEAEETVQPFTAVVAIEAEVYGTREQNRSVQVSRKQYLILPGSRLSEADFVPARKGTSIEAVPVDQIYNRLRLNYPKVLTFDVIEDYLCKLYGAFRGGDKIVGPHEAEAAARAFVQSIARKTVGSVDELIREQVLAESDFSEQIGHIASLMQNVQRLRGIAIALQASKQRLVGVKEHADAFMLAFEEAIEAELGEALRHEFDEKQKITAFQFDKGRALAEAEHEKGVSEKHSRALERATQLYGAALGRLNGNPIAQERKRLDDLIEPAKTDLAEIAVELLKAINSLRTALSELAALEQWSTKEDSAYKVKLDSLILELARIKIADVREAVNELAERLRNPEVDVANLPRSQFAVLDGALGSILEGIHGPEGLFALVTLEQVRQEERAKTLKDEIEDMGAKQRSLEAGRIDLPDHVEAAVRFLENKYPGARSRVLCNLVKPREGTAWQNAIEGLLGGNRFVILVAAEYEAKAIRAIRHEFKRPEQRGRGRDNNSSPSVVQGDLARKRATQSALAADSILHELEISDETARAYLVASYGRYVKVRDEEALRTTPQGLTVDGMASGNFKLFTAWADDGDLAFGAEARRKRAVALGRKIEEKGHQQKIHQDTARDLATWGGRLRTLGAVPILPKLDGLAEAQRHVNALVAEWESLDDAELAALERRVARAKRLTEGHQQLMATAAEASGKASGRAQELERKLVETQGQLDLRTEAVSRIKLRLVELVRLNSQFDPNALVRRVEACIADKSAEHFDGLRRQQTGLYRSHREEFEHKLEEHNRLASSLDEKVDYQPQDSSEGEYEWRAYGGVPDSRRQIAAMLDRLDKVRILNNDRQLEEAEQSFNNTFSTHFALAVRTAVEQGIQPLRRLNDKLKRLVFGEDRFEIEYGQMVKEYKKYFDLFQELNRLAETQTPVNLFSASEGVLSAESVAALEEIKGLLLNPNQEFALRRLKDIADYRNYRQYDIRKYSEDGREASLARMATFSGGELMTPAYLVRAAVLAQAFRQFEKTASLKLMMIDEAFDKMDEARTAAVMRYLNENLGLQLVVAMPSRSSGPLLDLFTFEHRFSLMKVSGLAGELDKVTEVDSSTLKNDRLRALWTRRREEVRAGAEKEFLLQEAKQQLAAELQP